MELQGFNMRIRDFLKKIKNLILLWELKQKIFSTNSLLWNDIEEIYRNEIKLNAFLVEKVCSVLPQDFDCLPDGEHGTPGEARYQKSGWHEKMLGRYFFAGYAFCRNKSVLDLCSGFGWGSKILANYANNVTCIEINKTLVKKAAEIWGTDKITWKPDNILNLDKRKISSKFDVVLAMEAIEHFTKDDGLKMLRQVKSLLKGNGIFIASSYYPNSNEQARNAEAQNPFHLHVWTQEEIVKACNKIFKKTTLIGEMILIAQN